jgi:hypothetical protein
LPQAHAGRVVERVGDRRRAQAQRDREPRGRARPPAAALRDNILTREVKANGFGGLDPGRLDKAIDPIGLAYTFKSARPKADDIFDASFLPPAAERRAE